MKRLVRNINIIALFAVAALVTGQDLYIFSIVGPSFDLLKGPEGIRDAQQFSNTRNAITTIVTHGLLLAIIVIVMTKPINIITTKEPDLK